LGITSPSSVDSLKSRYLRNLKVLRVAAPLLVKFIPLALTLPNLRVCSVFAMMGGDRGLKVSTALDAIEDFLSESSSHPRRLPIVTLSIYFVANKLPHDFFLHHPQLSTLRSGRVSEGAAQITRVELLADFSRTFSADAWTQVPGWLHRLFPTLRILVLNERSSFNAQLKLACEDDWDMLAMYGGGSSTLEQSVVVQNFMAAIKLLYSSEIQIIFGSLATSSS
jgi:hypothetical protein